MTAHTRSLKLAATTIVKTVAIHTHTSLRIGTQAQSRDGG